MAPAVSFDGSAVSDASSACALQAATISQGSTRIGWARKCGMTAFGSGLRLAYAFSTGNVGRVGPTHRTLDRSHAEEAAWFEAHPRPEERAKRASRRARAGTMEDRRLEASQVGY